MLTVDQQIKSIDEVITANIEQLAQERGLLSQNLLAQTRNLIEAVAVRLHSGVGTAPFAYKAVAPALAFVGSGNKRISFLHRFHKLIQISASHYTMDSNTSERLMLKYLDFMLRLRETLKTECGILALSNLEDFPIDLDPALQEYQAKIAEQIEGAALRPLPEGQRTRYYVHKTRPFFVDGRVYYEVTFYRAHNKANKADRIIAFTELEVGDKYAATLALESASIEVLGETMPITLIREWAISIRPCEFDALARIFGAETKVRSDSSEYQRLMYELTARDKGLLDLMDAPNSDYNAIRAGAIARIQKPQIFPTLDRARKLIGNKSPGANVVRYLLLRMRNQVLKPQWSEDQCYKLSNLHLKFGCIPFEEMPFCTSLVLHNPMYWDLAESLDATGRTHELLARVVKNNVENHGILYTPLADLLKVDAFKDVDQLVSTHNARLYKTHRLRRSLVKDMGHVFIQGYEDDTVTIIEKLQSMADSGIDGYAAAVESWLEENPGAIDDEVKRAAMGDLLSESHVALIYGAAGTGKSTMVHHIASYFNDKRKLFLAHTHPAKDNLKRRVSAQRSTFRTITSQILRRRAEPSYHLLVIDESSTVSNADLIDVLAKTEFKLLVLVGDVFQIASIEFGNWFNVIRRFIPKTAVFELTTPYRTNNIDLREFWEKVRNVDDDIAEAMAHGGYSTNLDASLFARHDDDEIILCLNYDGLYGINNINRFMQSSNPGAAITWGVATYKVGDPILFGDTDRFGGVIYNNLKGRIVGLERFADRAQFDVKLQRAISEFDIESDELEWLGDSTVRFSVYDRDTSDEDDDSSNNTVPFQVAYAVSIHKAQGLEYESVKVVVTQANEDDIVHSVFYTAVTRAKDRLQVLWSPETQQAVLTKLQSVDLSKDVQLLAKRRGLKPVK
ncbi:ATP-dependent RecD-like DNA helicase [Microbacterium sp.]|uniref:ATP-dependent RecD-like DNA helicase n=1 Tax=Microbacterium sp. TaxID=51671 RepID=UPI0028110C4B|nr:ATP-dependent RecD-like DNA helicase [Microbacterium sp.]